ncbi:MAG: hypothetical protein JWN81_371 [Solirubrobacterales bacterium]|nr:hypothetical protein [Solirubrobacterales bacterium]
MNTQWLVAKYIPDMRRREPTNVGVILIEPSGVAHGRFRAVRPDGTFDGRSARFAASGDNYRAHLRYWRHLIDQGFSPESVAAAIKPIGDESYFLEFGGARLSASADPTDPVVLLDQLYATLVEETPENENLGVSELSDAVIRQLAFPEGALHRNSRIEARIGGARDPLVFDYRFDNGAVNLMRNVPLSFADQRSWDAVHATVYSFKAAESILEAEGKQQRHISFVKPRSDDVELDRQLGVLGSQATVVDVSDPDRAKEELGNLLGV